MSIRMGIHELMELLTNAETEKEFKEVEQELKCRLKEGRIQLDIYKMSMEALTKRKTRVN